MRHIPGVIEMQTDNSCLRAINDMVQLVENKASEIFPARDMNNQLTTDINFQPKNNNVIGESINNYLGNGKYNTLV